MCFHEVDHNYKMTICAMSAQIFEEMFSVEYGNKNKKMATKGIVTDN